MKQSSVLMTIGLLIAGVFLGGWLMFKFRPVPEGMVLVPQSTVDSLAAYKAIADSLQTIANLPPDTVKTVEIIYRDTIIYVETTPVPQPDPSDSSVNVYQDTLSVDGEVHAWVKFKVRGYVLGNIQWAYQPIIKEVTTVVEKKVPYPVISYIDKPVPVTGNYLSLAAAGNDKMFIFGVDYDLVKKDVIYGLQYRRYGEVNIYGIKLGINLNTLFNKSRNGP